MHAQVSFHPEGRIAALMLSKLAYFGCDRQRMKAIVSVQLHYNHLTT